MRSTKKSEHKNDSKGGNINPNLQSKAMKRQPSTKRKKSVKKSIGRDSKATGTPTAAKSNLHLQIGKFQDREPYVNDHQYSSARNTFSPNTDLRKLDNLIKENTKKPPSHPLHTADSGQKLKHKSFYDTDQGYGSKYLTDAGVDSVYNLMRDQ